MSSGRYSFKPIVLLALSAVALSAPRVLGQAGVMPPPPPPQVPPPGSYVPSSTPPAAPGTFNPAQTAAPGGPATNAGNLGQKVQPPPAYVGNRGGYQVPPTVIVPSYGNYVQSPAGGFLNGAANLTSAQGQYWNDIENARITREQSYQASMDTRKKQIEFEQWYETVRPTAPKMLAKEKAADLDWARNFAQNSDIWSGRTLNVLYDSAIRSKYLYQGPNIPVDEKILRGLNVNEKGQNCNGGLLKENKLFWTETLDSEAYDKKRDEFTKNWNLAQKQVSNGDAVDRKTLRDLQSNLSALQEQLDAAVQDLTPTRWIESNRYLKQLKDGVRALESTRRGMQASYSLVGKVKTVADVCFYLAKNGLKFAPATAPPDYPAYSSFYLQLRAFEMSVTGGQ